MNEAIGFTLGVNQVVRNIQADRQVTEILDKIQRLGNTDQVIVEHMPKRNRTKTIIDLTGSTAKRAKRTVYVKTQAGRTRKNVGLNRIPVDEKYKDYIVKDETLPGLTNNPYQIASIVTLNQGTGVNERLGQHAYVKSIYLDVQARTEDSTTQSWDRWQIIVVHDTASCGAAVTYSQLYTETTPGSTQQLRNKEYTSRLRILSKKEGTINNCCYYDADAMQVKYSGRASASKKWQIKLSPSASGKITYDVGATTPTISNISQNNITVLAWSEKGTVKLNHKIRVNFSG